MGFCSVVTTTYGRSGGGFKIELVEIGVDLRLKVNDRSYLKKKKIDVNVILFNQS